MNVRLPFLLFLVFSFGACQSPAVEKDAARRPNILFAIADDASFPHMGAYGSDWVQTPAFDRVAREGVLFTRAYTPNAKCAPSRSCILTGRNSWQLEEAANHWPYFPDKFKTYVEVLGEHGYFTGFTGKGWGPGKVCERDGKLRQLTGPRFQEHQLEPPARHISNNDYASNFAAFLEAVPEEQPFCFWYGGIEPHRAYEYGAGVRLAGKDPADIDLVPPFWPDNDTVRTDLLDYAFEIEYFDRHLQHMIELLEERGELDNTLIVVTADNGMPFPRVKGQAYEQSNHLPLAIMWPAGIERPGRTIDDYVSFIDFAPTFLEVAGIEAIESGMQPIAGRSLTDLLYSDKEGLVNPARDYVLFGKERHDVGRPGDVGYPIRGIFKDNALYLINFEPDRWPAGNPETGYLNVDGSPTKTQVLQSRRQTTTRQFWEWSMGKRPPTELYRLDLDPYCLENLAGNPEYNTLQAAMDEQLREMLRDQGDPRMFGAGDRFDEYRYSNEADRQFYERYMRGDSVRAGWVNPSDFEEMAGEGQSVDR